MHILHGNRPYALSRNSHPITPFAPTGPTEYRDLRSRLLAKLERTLNATLPEEFVDGKVYSQDATMRWPDSVQDLDAIITSPPFFDSTRFHSANWMRLWMCGWEKNEFGTMPKRFVDERQKVSFSIYESVFALARERLKKHGVFVVHLGKSKKCDMAEELLEVSKPWFRESDLFVESVEHCESHGIRDKGTVTGHSYLVLS